MADKAYFQKFVLTTRVKLSNGKPIPWTDVGWNTGAMETTDALTISELSKMAEEQRGGVRVIDKATFDDLKKNSVRNSPKPVWKPGVMPLEIGPLRPLPKASSEKSSAAVPPAKTVEKIEAPATATGVFPADQTPIV